MNTNKTDVLYRGNVDILYKIGDTTIKKTSHNSGCDYLFMFVALCLCGNNMSEQSPKYLDLRKKQSSGDAYESILHSPSVLTGKYVSYSETNGYEARFTGVIQKKYISDELSQDGEYRFYICSDTEDFAYLDVSEDSLSKITDTVYAIVEWAMSVKNAEEQEEQQ